MSTTKKVWKRYKADEIEAAIYLVVPSLIGFGLFYFYPALRGLYMSFTDWDLLTDPNFIGVANYRRLFSDPRFWNSLRVTAMYVIYNIPIQTVLGLGIALLMNQMKNSTTFRAVIVLPWFIPNVVVGLLWLLLLNSTIGLVNQILELLSLSRIPFLRTVEFALPSIAGINIWRHMGYVGLVFFAGLQTIPGNLYEAARIDGANAWQAFQRITLPLLRPVIAFIVITTVIGSFQIFDTVAVTTQGGPVNATEVMIWFIFQHAFERFNMGYGSAASMVLFLILIIFTLSYVKLSRSGESDLG
ncbi:MAG: carbohydrate ABC transporter permease [Spirochaetaceae bacterium]